MPHVLRAALLAALWGAQSVAAVLAKPLRVWWGQRVQLHLGPWCFGADPDDVTRSLLYRRVPYNGGAAAFVDVTAVHTPDRAGLFVVAASRESGSGAVWVLPASLELWGDERMMLTLRRGRR